MNHTLIEQVILVAAHQYVMDYAAFAKADRSFDGGEFSRDLEAPREVTEAMVLLDRARMTTDEDGNPRYMTLEERVEQDTLEEFLGCGDNCHHCAVPADDSDPYAARLSYEDAEQEELEYEDA